MAIVCRSGLTSICEGGFYQTVSDGFDSEGRERAFAFAQHERRIAGEIDHRARLGAARAGVDHQIKLVLQPLADFLRVRERLLVAREDERRREHRLVELPEQRVPDRVSPYADAHRRSLLMLEAPPQLAPRPPQ